MTFNDDFNDFDTKTWGTAYPWDGATGGTNNPNHEEQWYLKSDFAKAQGIDTYVAHDGVLDINAAPTPAGLSSQVGGQPYTSGMITTDPSFSQTHGYFEMRAALPAGQGVWPAFWLLPTDHSWPPEIDVVETIGSEPDTLNTTVHYGAGNQHQGKATDLEGLTGDGQFHTYGVDWEADDITWYLDGKEVYQVATPAGFDKPMYMLANLAVGGDWPGSPDGTTQFPSTMSIDYIRAYSDDPNAVPAASAPEGGSAPSAGGAAPAGGSGSVPAAPSTGSNDAPVPVAGDAAHPAPVPAHASDPVAAPVAGTDSPGHAAPAEPVPHDGGAATAGPADPGSVPVPPVTAPPVAEAPAPSAPAAGAPPAGPSAGTGSAAAPVSQADGDGGHGGHAGWHRGDGFDLGSRDVDWGDWGKGAGNGAWHDLIQDALSHVPGSGAGGQAGASAFHDMVHGVVGAVGDALRDAGTHADWAGAHDLSALADAFGHGHSAHGLHA